MLDDRDAGAEKRGVNGAGAVVNRIDVERIDADECDTRIDLLLRQCAGEMRMIF